MQSGQKTINELTIEELKGELTKRGLETMGAKSVLFPIQLTSTMVTKSITNVITSTSCTNTNSRGQKPPTPGHWENQNHGVGFPNNEITRNNDPYTVTYGENPTERDNTYQTKIRDWPEESNLLPRENLQAAKDALPEYSGKKEEDPTRFLHTTRDVLLEAKIFRQRWVKVLAPQLKGDAGTWWGRIRAIDPTWEEFHKEFTNKFDGPQVKVKLHTELMGWKQYYGQATGDFVLQKNQLFRRLNTGLDEENAV